MDKNYEDKEIFLVFYLMIVFKIITYSSENALRIGEVLKLWSDLFPGSSSSSSSSSSLNDMLVAS